MRVLGLGWALLCGVAVWASPPVDPTYREFASATGHHGVSVQPEAGDYKKCDVVLYSLEGTTPERTEQWRSTLDFCPVRVLIKPGGEVVVFADRWGGGVHDKGLVIFKEGKELARIGVKELLTPEELDDHARVKGHFSWVSGAHFTFEGDTLEIQLGWGATRSVSLHTGTLVPGE